MDASKLGTTVKEGKNQKTLLSPEEENLIIQTFNDHKAVEDIAVLASYDEIVDKSYSLSAGQYFEIKTQYIDITSMEFKQKMKDYENVLSGLFEESKSLEKTIFNNLKKISYE